MVFMNPIPLFTSSCFSDFHLSRLVHFCFVLLPTVSFGEFLRKGVELVAKSRACKKMAGAMTCRGTADIGLTVVLSARERIATNDREAETHSVCTDL